MALPALPGEADLLQRGVDSETAVGKFRIEACIDTADRAFSHIEEATRDQAIAEKDVDVHAGAGHRLRLPGNKVIETRWSVLHESGLGMPGKDRLLYRCHRRQPNHCSGIGIVSDHPALAFPRGKALHRQAQGNNHMRFATQDRKIVAVERRSEMPPTIRKEVVEPRAGDPTALEHLLNEAHPMIG